MGDGVAGVICIWCPERHTLRVPQLGVVLVGGELHSCRTVLERGRWLRGIQPNRNIAGCADDHGCADDDCYTVDHGCADDDCCTIESSRDGIGWAGQCADRDVAPSVRVRIDGVAPSIDLSEGWWDAISASAN